MKKLSPLKSILFAAILLVSGCEKEQSYSGQGNARLKQEFLYNIDSQTMIGIVKEYEYNDQGKISRTSTPMYENRSITGTISYNLYDYDSSGRLAKITNYNANINSPTGFINLSNLIYEYSGDGLKTKESVEYPASGIKEYTDYEYTAGRLTGSKKYSNNKLESYIRYQYDNSGRLIKESTFASDGQGLSYTIHSYSGSLQIKSDFYTYSNKVLYRSITRTYDEGNNLINLESKEMVPSSSMMSFVMKYIYYQ
jgi:uncharacterized protein YcfL